MIAFLKKWLKGLGKSAPEPQPTASVSEIETVCRFLISKRHFAKSKSTIKYGALLPNQNGETSVYRMSGISDSEIWLIGEEFVRTPIAKERGSCSIYGRGDIEVKEVLEANLAVIPKPKPHPRHADIMNWPKGKEKKQMLATYLANKAILHFPLD